MVCDFEELDRCLVDDFVIQYCQELNKRDFSVKTEALSRKKTGNREYLDDCRTRDLMSKLNQFFESKVNVARIKFGKIQTIETLMNEEAQLFAKGKNNNPKAIISALT